jgi:hypothetical protein
MGTSYRRNVGRHLLPSRAFYLLWVLAASRTFAQSGTPPAIDVSQSSTPGVSGTSTYFFDLTPASGASISAVDADFSTDVAGAMRQVNPFNLPTIFNDNNGAIEIAGESPLADSQFEFHSNEPTLTFGSGENDMSLRAIFAGFSPRNSRFTLAHVVLADGALGTWRIGVLQMHAGGGESEHVLSGVFGSAVDVLAGDYNADGAVDSADYVLWRDTLGQSGTGLAADGNKNDLVDAGDYEVWRGNFGRTGGGNALESSSLNSTLPVTHRDRERSFAIPEPATSIMLLVTIIGAGVRETRVHGPRPRPSQRDGARSRLMRSHS